MNVAVIYRLRPLDFLRARLLSPGVFVAPVLFALTLAGCRHAPSGLQNGSGKTPPAAPPPVFAPVRITVPQEPLPLAPRTREQRADALIQMLQKRVWGRRASLPDIRRVADDVGPLVREAAAQPAVQPLLAQIARDRGQSVDEARTEWIAWEEADLLLEAGGSVDDVSTAGATGVAQWMPNIAREQGLKVDLAASRQLTARISDLNWRLAWLAYLARPDAAPDAPGRPAFAPGDPAQTVALQTERDALRAQRQLVDQRYDPRLAVFAHARYLLRLYARFPAYDWIFQAYHGGEGGAKKELRLYLGRKPASFAQAIRTGQAGQPLGYEDVYFGVTPHAHAAAFAYLYGRGDDHRHYWWKLRSSRLALAAYRQNPNAFAIQWAALLPGRRTEAVWYPDAPAHSIADLNVLRAANGRGLAPVASTPDLLVRAAPHDLLNAPAYAVLQMPAKGALLLVVSAYRQAGGKTSLVAGDLTLTPAYGAQVRALHPPRPSLLPVYPPDPAARALPGGGPPADFDYHTTGLAFDVLRPVTALDAETLDYALSRLEEQGIVAVTEARDNGERRWHIVPNPRCADALARLARTEQAPVIPDL